MALLVGVQAQSGTIPSALTAAAVTTLNVTLGQKPNTVLLVNVVQVAPPFTPAPTRLTVTPATASIVTQNGTVQLTATVLDQRGNPFTGATVVWQSSQPTAITVNSSGFVTGVQLNGNAIITASVANTSASGTAVVTTPASVPTTLTFNAGHPTLARAARAASNASSFFPSGLAWFTGTSVNDTQETDAGYAQVYAQMAHTDLGSGAIVCSERFKANWISAVTSATTVTTNFQEFGQEFAHLQANGSGIKVTLLDGNNASQWPGLTTYCTSPANANTILTAVVNAITGFFNPSSSPAYNAGTSYVFGNAVTSGGIKWTCVAAAGCTGITPAVGVFNSSGQYCWLQTQAGAVHSYALMDDAISFGVPGANPFTTQLGSPNTWLPGFAQAIHAADPGVGANGKLEIAGTHFAYDGTGNGSSAQNTATLSLMSAIATAGSVGGAGNLIVGIKGHVFASIMQLTAGGITAFNAAQFTSFLNSVNSAGYRYAITEFDVTDDLFIGTGAAGVALRDQVIGNAYAAYVAACVAAAADPEYFAVWQIRDPESSINVQALNPRSDGLPQRPDLYADFFGSTSVRGVAIPTQKSSYYQLLQALTNLSPIQSSVVLNDPYNHQLYPSLVDQWGFQVPAAIIGFGGVVGSGIVPNPTVPFTIAAISGGASATVSANVTTPPLTASVTVTSAASVLTSLSITPTAVTIAGGTVQLTTAGIDQYGVSSSSPGGLTWVSSNASVVTVNSSGLVTYVSNGVANVQAYATSNPNIAATCVVTAQLILVPTISGIAPSSTTLNTQGATVTLTATVVDQLGHVFPLSVPLTWTSSDSSHIPVASTGILTAVATAQGTGGQATITASIAGTSPLVSATCTVSTPLTAATSIVLAVPGTLQPLVNDGQNHVITPTVKDQFGNPMQTGSLTWASDNTNIPVDQTGTFHVLLGSQTAHITATQGTIVGTITLVSSAPVLTQLVLSPGNATLTSGSLTETPTPSDQFGNAIAFTGASTGGAMSLTASGTAYCANVAAVQALANEMSVVCRVRVDNWAALGGFNAIPVFSIDDGTGGGANRKFSVTLENNGTGLFRAAISNASLTHLATGNIPSTSMPANGQDVIVYAWWRGQVGGTTDNHGVSVYKGDGSNTLIDPNATVLNTGNQGQMSTAAGNGQVGINVAAGTAVSRSMICQGIGVFNKLRAAGSESAKPATSPLDPTLLYYCAFSDATSGTSPSSATAQVGSNAMVPTVGQFAWTGDSSPGAWNGTAAQYAWTSSNPAAATVDGSGHVGFVAPGTTTVAVALQTTTATGSAVITCTGTPIPTTPVINPTSLALTNVGATGVITFTVLDQFGNTMSGVTITSVSSNTAAATVTGSGTPIVVTAVAGGTATITVTGTIGSNSVHATCATTVTTSTTFNQPAGMVTQIATGKMTAIPANFSVFSPSTPTSVGEWNGNLTVTPPGTANDTGLRITYPTNLVAGNSPVRFAPANFASGGTPQGTGYYYHRQRIRYSANFTSAGNPAVKICEPQSENHGSGAGATSNPVIFAWASPFGNTKLVCAWAKQGPNGSFANYVPQTAPFIITDGNWHYIEISLTPESSIGAGDGIIDIWVDVVNHFQQTGVQFLTGGMTVGWPSVLYDPVYGGTTSAPPATMFLDFDDLFIATK